MAVRDGAALGVVRISRRRSPCHLRAASRVWLGSWPWRRLEKLLATGVVKDFRTLARLGHVSSARVSQILSLLHLAPDIQEALLFRSRTERGRDSLGLGKVLPLTKVWDWQKQRRMWRGLADSRLAGPKPGAKLAM